MLGLLFDASGMGFFIGSLVFPLLIFNTVATAELHSVNYGIILACSLGKVAVMVLTWLLAYATYRPQRRAWAGFWKGKEIFFIRNGCERASRELIDRVRHHEKGVKRL